MFKRHALDTHGYTLWSLKVADAVKMVSELRPVREFSLLKSKVPNPLWGILGEHGRLYDLCIQSVETGAVTRASGQCHHEAMVYIIDCNMRSTPKQLEEISSFIH